MRFLIFVAVSAPIIAKFRKDLRVNCSERQDFFTFWKISPQMIDQRSFVPKECRKATCFSHGDIRRALSCVI